MPVDSALLDSARAAFAGDQPAIVLGAIQQGTEAHPEPLARLPLAMLNRHGLIAGATGTGKTKSLQLFAEQCSAAGIPVLVADVKGDLQGLAAPGATSDRVATRVKETGVTWQPAGCPVEFLSLTGKLGAQLRATVSSFGPMLLSKVLDLNETQTSVLSLVFKYCDDNGLLLLDFADLRTVLQWLTGDGADELKAYGGMSKQTVGVLLREMVELEQQGALAFFGEPEFEIEDLLQVKNGKGLISVLELKDVQDKPALWSTFLMWVLARLYATLPEVGDLEKPKLVFFFDEAHLLFDDASKALQSQIEQVVRLVRSKGVGIFFITQSPRDVPAEVLGQLGHRVQHALRAFTPDDEKALKSAARTYPKTEFYDVAEVLTTLGIGEALVSTLTARGTPTPPFAVRMAPPSSLMASLPDADFAAAIAKSGQVKKYATAIDRESAHEVLDKRMHEGTEAEQAPDAEAEPSPAKRGRATAAPKSAVEEILSSPVARAVATQAARTLTRTLLGALLGSPRRRR
jgi:DNA helicase HerA-like ATPase